MELDFKSKVPLTWQIESDKYRAGMQNANAMLNIQLNTGNLRKRLGVTQRELARRAGMTHANYHNFESGKADGITIQTLSKLAEVFGVTIIDLISEPRENYTPTFTYHVHENMWATPVLGEQSI